MSTSHPAHRSTEELIAQLVRSGSSELRATIIERHASLVQTLARKFTRPGVATEDLVQTGWIAVIGALDRFAPGHETKFRTYVVHCIVGELKRYFRDRTWAIKVPRLLQEIGASLPRTHEALVHQLRREPTMGEMAAALGIDEETLAQAMDLHSSYRLPSLDDRTATSAGGESQSIADTVGRDDAAIETMVENSPLHQALAELDERHRLIVRRRFYEGCSQQEVADELHLSQMQISRLERTALKRLRRSMATPA